MENAFDLFSTKEEKQKFFEYAVKYINKNPHFFDDCSKTGINTELISGLTATSFSFLFYGVAGTALTILGSALGIQNKYDKRFNEKLGEIAIAFMQENAQQRTTSEIIEKRYNFYQLKYKNFKTKTIIFYVEKAKGYLDWYYKNYALIAQSYYNFEFNIAPFITKIKTKWRLNQNSVIQINGMNTDYHVNKIVKTTYDFVANMGSVAFSLMFNEKIEQTHYSWFEKELIGIYLFIDKDTSKKGYYWNKNGGVLLKETDFFLDDLYEFYKTEFYITKEIFKKWIIEMEGDLKCLDDWKMKGKIQPRQ